jgi:hypothetical protein
MRAWNALIFIGRFVFVRLLVFRGWLVVVCAYLTAVDEKQIR